MNVIVILVDNLNRHHLPAYGGGPRPWEPSTSSSTARRTLTSNETCGTTSQESAQGMLKLTRAMIPDEGAPAVQYGRLGVPV